MRGTAASDLSARLRQTRHSLRQCESLVWIARNHGYARTFSCLITSLCTVGGGTVGGSEEPKRIQALPESPLEATVRATRRGGRTVARIAHSLVQRSSP